MLNPQPHYFVKFQNIINWYRIIKKEIIKIIYLLKKQSTTAREPLS